jgi:hypothetical protein
LNLLLLIILNIVVFIKTLKFGTNIASLFLVFFPLADFRSEILKGKFTLIEA